MEWNPDANFASIFIEVDEKSKAGVSGEQLGVQRPYPDTNIWTMGAHCTPESPFLDNTLAAWENIMAEWGPEFSYDWDDCLQKCLEASKKYDRRVCCVGSGGHLTSCRLVDSPVYTHELYDGLRPWPMGGAALITADGDLLPPENPKQGELGFDCKMTEAGERPQCGENQCCGVYKFREQDADQFEVCNDIDASTYQETVKFDCILNAKYLILPYTFLLALCLDFII